MPLPVHLNIPLQNNCSGGESEGDTLLSFYTGSPDILQHYPLCNIFMEIGVIEAQNLLNMVALKGSNYLAQKC